MENVRVGNRTGTLHFIRFPTSEMPQFLELSKSKGMATLASTICATGGGAYKFEQDFQRVGITSPSSPPAAGGPPCVGRDGMVALGRGSQVVVLLALRGTYNFLFALSPFSLTLGWYIAKLLSGLQYSQGLSVMAQNSR